MFQLNLKRITAMLISACNQLIDKTAIIPNRLKVAAAP
jgi:3-methyladenine DNA glycosylase Tag